MSINQETLHEKYKAVRKATEAICAPLKTEDYVPQPETFVSPAKWHLGHTTWFFEGMVLKANEPDYQEFDSRFSFIFNSYYESVGTHILRSKRGDLSRPTVEDTYAYRRHVDLAMERFLSKPRDQKILEIIELGLNHEQQHQELLWTDIKYTLGVNPFMPKYGEAIGENHNEGEAGFVKVEGGLYEIGFQGEGFCYDNELGRHKVYLEPFEISKHLVTNGEFIEFIESGAYTKSRLWHSQGWNWIKENKIQMPLYWKKEEDGYYYFTMGGYKKVDPAAQVSHVSYFEAYAFARWKGMRLPTEAEWEVAQKSFQWGTRWEWTESSYLPYPGYEQDEGSLGEYNGKFMVSQKVLRGASVATPEGHSRPTYRNYFYPPERWQFTGIRLAKK